jgi:Uncharacterized conserved protein
MKIAIPVEMGQVCPHFGHAPEFVVFITEEGKNHQDGNPRESWP